jgi:hypothetical protein
MEIQMMSAEINEGSKQAMMRKDIINDEEIKMSITER